MNCKTPRRGETRDGDDARPVWHKCNDGMNNHTTRLRGRNFKVKAPLSERNETCKRRYFSRWFKDKRLVGEQTLNESILWKRKRGETEGGGEQSKKTDQLHDTSIQINSPTPTSQRETSKCALCYISTTLTPLPHNLANPELMGIPFHQGDVKNGLHASI